jgi:y4mF family transcriptional regulator
MLVTEWLHHEHITARLQVTGMSVRSIRDAAVAVRGRRTDLGMSQDELASRAGVSRKWVVEFESGKPSAEFALVIRVLDALGLVIELGPPNEPRDGAPVDLDDILDEHRGR